MNTFKVIFLDYDGVLNSYATMPIKDKGMIFTLHRPLVQNLNVLVERTGAKVVVSSSWRKGHDWKEVLIAAGFTGDVLDRTGTDPKGFRGEEVDEWLRKWGRDVETYAIIDDDHDFYPWQPVWHPTLFTGGLTPEIVERIAFHFESNSRDTA